MLEVKTRIMELGLRDDICQPVYPLLVRVQIAEAFSSLAILAAWKQTDLVIILLAFLPGTIKGLLISGESSTLQMIFSIVFITSTGNLPTEVSPESITASAPSITELATSFTSALEGVRLSIIDSII